MKVLERALLPIAIATLLSCGSAYGQSTGNLLVNPDVVLDAYDGRTSQTVSGSPGSAPVAFGGTAAADWAFVTLQLGTITIETELVPSDFMPGSQMLHVHAQGVGFLQLRPTLSDSSLQYGHRATFCAWVKVAQGGGVSVQAADTPTGGLPTGGWQQLVDNTDHTTPNGPAITVVTQQPAGGAATGIALGDVDFYVATADYTPRMLAACPRATLDDVSYRRRPLEVPPREPQVEHPDWDRPDHNGSGDASPFQRRRGSPSKPDQKTQQVAPAPNK